jgi:hypothetical protein
MKKDEKDKNQAGVPEGYESSHLMVNDSAYENYGQFLLGLTGADPMG